MLRSFRFICVFLPLLFPLLGCGKSEEVTVLKLAHGLDTGHPVHHAMVRMAEEVARRSDGSIRIDIYPSEQLGSERECLELVQLGILSMVKVSTAPMEGFVEQMKVFGLPYLFRDSEHMWTVLNGSIGREILDAGTAKGLRGLCFYDSGARSFYTTEKPIRTPADLVGMKIRVQKSEMAMQMIEALGGSPTPIDWGELYTALQQGMIDGAENNPPSFCLSRHYENCKYYTLDQHVRQPDVIVINSTVWASLTPAQQNILQASADVSVAFQRKLWAKTSAENLATVEAAGIEIIHPDKTAFRRAVHPLWTRFEGTLIGDLAQRIQAVK